MVSQRALTTAAAAGAIVAPAQQGSHPLPSMLNGRRPVVTEATTVSSSQQQLNSSPSVLRSQTSHHQQQLPLLRQSNHSLSSPLTNSSVDLSNPQYQQRSSCSRIASSLPTTTTSFNNQVASFKLTHHNHHDHHHHHHQFQRHQPTATQEWKSSSSALASTTAKLPVASASTLVNQSIRLHRKSLLAQQRSAALASSHQSLVAPQSAAAAARSQKLPHHTTTGNRLLATARSNITTNSLLLTQPTTLSCCRPKTVTKHSSASVSEALVSCRQQKQQQLAPSTAVTNSRLRQGALYAHRHQPNSAASSSNAAARGRLIVNQQPLKQQLPSRFANNSRLIKSAQSSQSLSCIRARNSPRPSVVNSSDYQRQDVSNSKTSSRFSLNSSTSSLTLAIVKRVKPSPQTNSASRFASLDRSQSPALTRRVAARTSATSNKPQSSQEAIARRGTVLAAGGCLATGRSGSRCATYLSAGHRNTSARTSAAALNVRKPAAATAPAVTTQRANSASANVNINVVVNTSENSEHQQRHIVNNSKQQPFSPVSDNLMTATSCGHIDIDDNLLKKPVKLLTNTEPAPFSDISERFVVMRRSDSLESNIESVSPLITPPPSELDVDVDEDDMIARGDLPVVAPTIKEDEITTTAIKAKLGPLTELVTNSVKSPLPNIIINTNNNNNKRPPVDIPIRTESISDYYDLEARPFARGKFAQVKRCISKLSQQCFAAKCIKKRRRSTDIRHEILLEIEALKLSYHTNRIVKLYEVFETPTEMILVLEMANGGELQRVLDDEEAIAEKLVKRMVRQILDGLILLHDSNIAHLDIKPQNLLLTETFPDGDIKLCDFGISRRITKDCEIREICGTPDYVAPEILRYDPISLATDMWSLGVLTYVLLSGYSPFGSESKQQTFCNITQAKLDFPSEIFDKISQDAIDFMQKLIIGEPSDRLTSRQARVHPWLNCH